MVKTLKHVIGVSFRTFAVLMVISTGLSANTLAQTMTVNIQNVSNDGGYNYLVAQNFGTRSDTSAGPTVSTLRIFENGKALGPPHSVHAAIRDFGQGRFSHWSTSGGTASILYFSASDNTDPRTNGRTYTFRIDFQSTPIPAPPSDSPPLAGTIQATMAYPDGGNNYFVAQDFGTASDTAVAPAVSKLRIFENGKELGPAHSFHAYIRDFGQGSFSHWGSTGGTTSILYFSASDNTDPRFNGRKYTYRIDSESAQPPSASIDPVFYVSPDGSDSNPGTLSAPWRTIQMAALTLTAGATAILLDGMYKESQILFGNDGTPGRQITIRAQNKWRAILSSISGCAPAISVHRSHIAIEDLRISVSPSNVSCSIYTSKNAAIRAWSTADPTPANASSGTQGFTARGVLIDYSAARSTGIKTNQDFSLVENSVIHSELEGFNNYGTIFRNNVIYDGGPNGTHILGKGGMRNFQVYNNVVHITQNNSTGIMLGGGPFAYWDRSTNIECYNCVAYNNIVLNEGPGATVGLLGMRGAKDSAFFNNVAIGGMIFLMPSDPSGAYPPPGFNVNPTFQNNIVTCKNGALTSGAFGWNGFYTGILTLDSNNFYDCSSAMPSQTNAISGDPKFVNPASDWHFEPQSPARDSGVEVKILGFEGQSIDVSRNRDGVTRTIPWSLGVY